MSSFVKGEDRRQAMLLPSFLDDYVGEDSPARVSSSLASPLSDV